MMFEDACDDGLSYGSLDLDESLDFDFDFPVQTAPAPASVAFEKPQQTVMMQPRMVSMDSMSSVRKLTPKQGGSSTPYASLKLLVKNKQQGLKRSSEDRPVASTGENSAAMIEDDCKPSSFLRAFRANKETQPSPKRRAVADPSVLHRACSQKKLSLEIVKGILREDPWAAGRQQTLFTEAKVYNYLSYRLETKTVRESYTFALNLALENQVDLTVVKSLIEADKTVLSKKDGLEKEGSLHVALKQKQANISTVDAIILANPSSVQVEDRHFNTPLHIACRSAASMDVIRHLWILYPEALFKRNFNGLTPLDLARNNGIMCSNEVSNFLWNKVQETDRMA
jgi:hypothetical protein